MRELRSAVADWLQILSAPLTIAGAYGAWHVQRNAHGFTEKQVLALLLLATLAAWVFLFTAYWRLVMRFASPIQDEKPVTAFCLFLVGGFIGWILLVAFELFITEAMLPHNNTLDQFLWIAAPSVLWLFMGFLLYMAHGTES